MNDSTTAVIELVANVLELPPASVGPDASMDTVADWDSLAQLTICMAFQDRFAIVMEMDQIARATSVHALVALL